MDAGLASPGETEQIITGLGVDYQIVTDYTSMVVLSDQAFAQRGIERRNRSRIALEREARAQRARQPVASRRVDQNRPMFKHKSPSSGSGGPALDPITGLIGLGLGGLSLVAARRRKHGRGSRAESRSSSRV
jgi:Ca-activated chloride channel family protein